MKDDITSAHGACIGFIQETENGGIYEIGNGWIHRRIMRLGGVITTTSLVNVVNGEEYLEECQNEFSIELNSSYEDLTLTSSNFEFVAVSTPVWNDQDKQIKFNLTADVSGETFDISLHYSVSSAQNYMLKWLELGELTGWEIGEVVLEDMQLVSAVQAVKPILSTESADGAEGRFRYGQFSEAVAELWGCTEGIFALSAAIESEVLFNSESMLNISLHMNITSEMRNVTDPAVIGMYRGLPEYGFYKYREAKDDLAEMILYEVDAPKAPLSIQSVASLRAQIYDIAWQEPYSWMDFTLVWDWLETADILPKSEFLHVLLSLIGILPVDGIEILAGVAPDDECRNAVEKVMVFLDQHRHYFFDYRHLLWIPDGKIVDAHAHFDGESGFIVVVNPSEEATLLELPLKEPGIWLSLSKKHKITDHSNLSVVIPLDDSKTEPAPEIALAPYQVKIYGINIPDE